MMCRVKKGGARLGNQAPLQVLRLAPERGARRCADGHRCHARRWAIDQGQRIRRLTKREVPSRRNSARIRQAGPVCSDVDPDLIELATSVMQ
jgi:hypothetical protein